MQFETVGHCTDALHVEMIGLVAGIVPYKFQAVSSTFSPAKSQISVLFDMPPPPGGFLLSILVPNWQPEH